MLRRRVSCSGCGTSPADWDPARGGHPQAFVVQMHQCPGCRDLAMARSTLDNLPEFSRAGTRLHLVPNTDLPMWQGIPPM